MEGLLLNRLVTGDTLVVETDDATLALTITDFEKRQAAVSGGGFDEPTLATVLSLDVTGWIGKESLSEGQYAVLLTEEGCVRTSQIRSLRVTRERTANSPRTTAGIV